MIALYRNYLPSDVQDTPVGRKNMAEKIKLAVGDLRRIEKHKKPGRLLDVGAAAGIFLNCARDRGWTVDGTEMSRSCIAFARKRYGLHLKEGAVPDVQFKTGDYDVITLLQSIEHLPDPVGDLRILHKALKADGIVFISTPEHAKDLEKLKANHMLPQHLYNFTRETLEKVLLAAGFRPLSYEGYLTRSGIENMNLVAAKTGGRS